MPANPQQHIVQRSVYANEFDPHAAHWLSCLPLQIDFIDDRSIKDVTGNDVSRFTQCHFFAGIGGWPLALEMAGWPDDATVWTGSCPCQPFSAAGKRKGVKDDRHLWPEFRRLIHECRPATIFGEQVASEDGRNWLSDVRTDLEALGYAVGAADLCAAGVGAPHIRQRLFWVAHRSGSRLEERQEQPTLQELATVERSGDVGRMANAGRERSDKGHRPRGRLAARERSEPSINDKHGSWLGNAQSVRSGGRVRCEPSQPQRDRSSLPAGSSHWDGVEWLPCSDGKARPTKPGVCVLAHGVSGRVAQIRGLGNAIVPQVAAEFIAAVMDSIR